MGLIRPSMMAQRAAVAMCTVRASHNVAKEFHGQPTLQIDAFKKSHQLHRPISPHLFIYQPQLTWYMSMFHRITGVAVGGIFYGAFAWYAIAPFTSASVAATVATLPFIIKFLGKAAIAFPTVYHSLNGVRHLVWDTASALSLKGVYQGGYVVLIGTAVLGLGICLL
ncbi:cytochrome b subunit of succinate dehydrogenase, Sdh3p [Blyttiomyces sp. JEL0837]|nr:cytochrome b subunit of succinate dehydrogenase, Sdh3p [Blyttiomyces sp. JEL0837]